MYTLQMANTIEHQGIVENIEGTRLRVRIVQTSACASCKAKGSCSSADTKEKLIDVTAPGDVSCRVGDHVWVTGELSMGVKAVSLAFVIPFLILIVALFGCMAIWGNELYAALCSLALLVPYYFIVWLNKGRLSRTLSFSIRPMNELDSY